MVVENWPFVKNFARATQMVCYKLEVNHLPYADVFLPEEDTDGPDPTVVMNACYDLIEQDPDFLLHKISSCYINTDKRVVGIYLYTYRDYNCGVFD